MLTCFPPNVFLTLTPDPEKLKKENGEEDVIGDIGYLLVKSSIYILAIQFCAWTSSNHYMDYRKL